MSDSNTTNPPYSSMELALHSIALLASRRDAAARQQEPNEDLRAEDFARLLLRFDTDRMRLFWTFEYEPAQALMLRNLLAEILRTGIYMLERANAVEIDAPYDPPPPLPAVMTPHVL